MTEQPVIEVRDNPSANRFEVYVSGALAGFVVYERRDQQVIFIHTEVEDGYEGQGVGGALARGALDDVRRQGQRAVVICPFIAAYVQRHPEYQDLVDPY